MKQITKARIHRLNDLVAISLGNGQTVYLDEQLAWDLGNKLKEAAADISQVSFGLSKFQTQIVGQP